MFVWMLRLGCLKGRTIWECWRPNFLQVHLLLHQPVSFGLQQSESRPTDHDWTRRYQILRSKGEELFSALSKKNWKQWRYLSRLGLFKISGVSVFNHKNLCKNETAVYSRRANPAVVISAKSLQLMAALKRSCSSRTTARNSTLMEPLQLSMKIERGLLR